MHYFEGYEITALLQAAYERNRVHHLLMLVSLCHGLRVSEAIGLTSADVQGTSLVVRALKECPDQIQPLHFSDTALFDERSLVWHAGAIADSATKDKRLFPMCRQRADQLIRRYGRIAGVIAAKCHFHTWRHSTAMLVWETSHSLSQVQQVLGHRSMSTSIIYLRESDRNKGLVSLRTGLESVAACK
jgi:integrase